MKQKIRHHLKLSTTSTPAYTHIIIEETYNTIVEYHQDICNKNVLPGERLQNLLTKENIHSLSIDTFLELLMRTKKISMFAEIGIGENEWNDRESRILGDVNIAMDVTIFDDGVHHGNISIHTPPFNGTLLFVAGAVLKKTHTGEEINASKSRATCDMKEVIIDGKIDDDKLYNLYKKRLLPSLVHANNNTNENGALITIPGIGCGSFAGDFKGQLEGKLYRIITKLLTKYATSLPNIRGVVFDPNKEKEDCKNSTQCIEHITFITKAGENGKYNSQLNKPSFYDATFAGCTFFSITAADPYSLPGNEFLAYSLRQTDEGVKAAATNVGSNLTQHEGEYNDTIHQFKPKSSHLDKTWKTIINEKGITLQVRNNMTIVTTDAKQLSLEALLEERRKETEPSWLTRQRASSVTSAITPVTLKAKKLDNEMHLVISFNEEQHKHYCNNLLKQHIGVTLPSYSKNELHITQNKEQPLHVSTTQNEELALHFRNNTLLQKFCILFNLSITNELSHFKGAGNKITSDARKMNNNNGIAIIFNKQVTTTSIKKETENTLKLSNKSNPKQLREDSPRLSTAEENSPRLRRSSRSHALTQSQERSASPSR